MLIENDNGRRYDRFRGRVMFPIRDRRGRVIGFGGRVLGDGTPKYLNSPETPIFHKGRELYGLYEVLQAHREPEKLLVVEGYMDVVAWRNLALITPWPRWAPQPPAIISRPCSVKPVLWCAVTMVTAQAAMPLGVPWSKPCRTLTTAAS
ncbi:DNA primase [Photobacterium aphoticum]|uniref:DNA primase n=1 Tax=Photobacterium aphoticum TaxID=754436 RepID=A0A090QXQ6_9GAMM|nr:DNA primase [Photobacterium aphoticum]